MRHEVQAGEDEHMNDHEVGEEDEARSGARQNEAGEVERELVVQLETRVALLLLAQVKFRERIEFAFVVARVLVEHE